MERQTAMEVYELILKEVNGWSQEDVDKLTFGDVEGDQIFEGLIKIETNTDDKSSPEEVQEG